MQYILDHPDLILQRTWEHIEMVGLAIIIAAIIGVPLGILISRVSWLELPILNVTGVLYTVPSLAFFAILIPYTGLGLKTAVTALAVYSLLAIVRNTAAGLDEVSAPINDAAMGMGMTGIQRLRMVELPLALPYIFAGLRIATVAAIGIAAIAAVVGAGGLGRPIFAGIRKLDTSPIVAGAVGSIILAVLVDLIFSRLALVLRPDMRAGTGEGS